MPESPLLSVSPSHHELEPTHPDPEPIRRRLHYAQHAATYQMHLQETRGPQQLNVNGTIQPESLLFSNVNWKFNHFACEKRHMDLRVLIQVVGPWRGPMVCLSGQLDQWLPDATARPHL